MNLISLLAAVVTVFSGGPAARPAEDDQRVALTMAVAAWVTPDSHPIYEWTGKYLFVGVVDDRTECATGATWHRGQWNELSVTCP